MRRAGGRSAGDPAGAGRSASAGPAQTHVPPRCELRPGGRLSHAQWRARAGPRTRRPRAARGWRAADHRAVRAGLPADHDRPRVASRPEHGGRVARAGRGSAPARVRGLPRYGHDDHRGLVRRAAAHRGHAGSPDRRRRSVRGDDAGYGRQGDHLRAPDREPRRRAGEVLDLGTARRARPPRSRRGRARDLLPQPGARAILLRPHRQTRQAAGGRVPRRRGAAHRTAFRAACADGARRSRVRAWRPAGGAQGRDRRVARLAAARAEARADQAAGMRSKPHRPGGPAWARTAAS